MEQKKLYRSQRNKMLCGICGGLGDYFNLDPTIVRVLFILFGFCVGAGVLIYLLCAIIIPVNPDEF